MSKLVPRTRTLCTPYGSWDSSGSPGPPPTAAPTITVQPVTQTVTAPNAATFTVTASGTAPLNYQWYMNGAPVGSNSSTFNTGPTTLAQNGYGVDVVVTNSVGSATSAFATLYVNSGATPAAPAVTTQPNSVSSTEASTAIYTMTAAASGYPAPTWQWFEDSSTTPTTPLASTAFVTVNSNQLVFDMNFKPALGGVALFRTYHAVATNASGSASTNVASLQITPSGSSANISVPQATFRILGIQPTVNIGASTMVIKRGTTWSHTMTAGVNYTVDSAVARILSGTAPPVTIKHEVYNADGTLTYTLAGWPTGFVFSSTPTMWILIDDIALPPGRTFAGVNVDSSLTIAVYEGATLKGSQTWTSSDVGAWLAAHPAGGLRFVTFNTSATIPSNLQVVITINGKYVYPNFGTVYTDNYITFSSAGIYLQGAP